jgi:uncharacterized membrane protein
MSLTPLLAVHIAAALSALVLGPFALWARLTRIVHPKLHRAFGYAWVTMMLATATSAIWIKTDVARGRWNGFSAIHLLIIVIYVSLIASFWFLYRGNVRAHKYTMITLYINACLITGLFTLSPGRLMNFWLLGGL